MSINRQVYFRPEPLARFAAFCQSPFSRRKGVRALRLRGEGHRRKRSEKANKHEGHFVVSELSCGQTIELRKRKHMISPAAQDRYEDRR
jgi:hypothetical protein